MKRVHLIPLWSLLFFLGTALTAMAQQRTLSIQDGRVYINGEAVAAEALPASLDPRGMNVNFSFTGDTGAILELNDVFYLLDDQGLHEVEPWQAKAGDLSVFFRREKGEKDAVERFGAPLLKNRDAEPGEAYFVFAGESMGRVMQQYLEELDTRAQSLQQLSAQMTAQRQNDAPRLLFEAHRQAAEAARVADALPRIEVQSYLYDVQKHDHGLFEQLLREQDMEQESLQLAARIRAMDDTAARHRLVEELRHKLDRSFELKQMNRRSEIEQLQARLIELQNRLNEREQMRERIIQLRMKELLGDLGSGR